MDVPLGMIDDIHQRLTLHTPRRLVIDAPEAAVLIAITRSATPEILFTRRSLQLSSHKGEVAFPGGKRDLADQDLLHTALRESYEEIGLAAERVEILGSVGDVVSRFGIKVTPFVGVIHDSEQLTINPAELDRIFRVPVSYFLETKPQKIDTLRYRGEEFYVPAWQYGEYSIWGLTALMLAEFLNVGLGANLALTAHQTLSL